MNCDDLTNITDVVPGHYSFSIDVRDSQTRVIAVPAAISVLDAVTGEKLHNTTSTSGGTLLPLGRAASVLYRIGEQYFPYSGLAEGETLRSPGNCRQLFCLKNHFRKHCNKHDNCLDENNAETSAFVELYQDNQFEQGALVNGRQSFSLKKDAQYFAIVTKDGYEAADASFKSGENPSIKL